MKWLELPSVYRVHDEPPTKKMEEFMLFAKNMNIPIAPSKKTVTAKKLQDILSNSADKDYHSVISTMLLRSMSKAAYSENCSGHFGLALQEYLHFTSPIRRYADLIVHRNLRKYYFKQNYDIEAMQAGKQSVVEIAKYISEQERKIMTVEYAVEDMKKAEYMLKYQNQQVSGIITSVTKYGFYVELANTVEGLVHISSLSGYFDFDAGKHRLVNFANKQTYQLGQRVDCLVRYVNKDQRVIEFEVLNTPRFEKDKAQHPRWAEYKKKKTKRGKKDGKDYNY